MTLTICKWNLSQRYIDEQETFSNISLKSVKGYAEQFRLLNKNDKPEFDPVKMNYFGLTLCAIKVLRV